MNFLAKAKQKEKNTIIESCILWSVKTDKDKEEALNLLQNMLLLLREVDSRVVDIQFEYEDVEGLPLGQRVSKFLDKYYDST